MSTNSINLCDVDIYMATGDDAREIREEMGSKDIDKPIVCVDGGDLTWETVEEAWVEFGIYPNHLDPAALAEHALWHVVTFREFAGVCWRVFRFRWLKSGLARKIKRFARIRNRC